MEYDRGEDIGGIEGKGGEGKGEDGEESGEGWGGRVEGGGGGKKMPVVGILEERC